MSARSKPISTYNGLYRMRCGAHDVRVLKRLLVGVDRAISHLEPGEIILMHVGSAPDNSTLDADALSRIIPAIRAHGYQFVTLSGYF